MTEHEIEKMYLAMTEAETPDLWDRIEAACADEVNVMEKEKDVKQEKESLGRRFRRWVFGGSTARLAAAVCIVGVFCAALLNGAAGTFRMGSAGGAMAKSSYALSSGTGQAAYDNAAPMEAEMPEAAAEDAYDGVTTAETGAASQAADIVDEAAASGRKLIRDISLSVETLEFDTLLQTLKEKTEAAGGYVESSSVSGGDSYYGSSSRYGFLTLRIPSGKTDAFLADLDDASNVLSRSENVQDVTLTYVDLESHVNALRAEEEQLKALMERAETVEELMSIQSALTDVRYQLESYASQLKVYDNMVTYDTVRVDISEVKKETQVGERSVWQRMADGFGESLIGLGEGIRDFCIWFVSSIPYFIAFFIVVYVILRVVKLLLGRRKNRKKDKA